MLCGKKRKCWQFSDTDICELNPLNVFAKDATPPPNEPLLPPSQPQRRNEWQLRVAKSCNNQHFLIMSLENKPVVNIFPRTFYSCRTRAVVVPCAVVCGSEWVHCTSVSQPSSVYTLLFSLWLRVCEWVTQAHIHTHFWMTVAAGLSFHSKPVFHVPQQELWTVCTVTGELKVVTQTCCTHVWMIWFFILRPFAACDFPLPLPVTLTSLSE